MPAISIDFQWQRDDAGYEMRDAQEAISVTARPEEGATLISSFALNLAPRQPPRIVRRGGQLRAYHPLLSHERLFSIFARDAVTSKGVLGFVERFGPLTNLGLDPNQGDDVEAIIAHATEMRGVLDAYERQSKRDIAQALGPKGKRLRESAISTIEVKLIFDPAEKTPKLEFTAPNLLTALWLQLAQTLASGANLQKCLQCNALFEVGQGTRRRADAKFCSDAHRVEFNSRKRSKKGEEPSCAE